MNTLRNQVQLIGNLGNDPEITTFDNGKKMAKFSLATNESYTNATGEKIEKTQWHRVVFFGKTVDFIEKYMQKGKEVLVSGKITYGEYTDKDGNKRYSTDIVGNELLALGNKS
jgi:single-strand DNA-binding protein